MQAPDYSSLVATPMDFGTISNRLQAGKYRSPDQVLRDVELIWNNCLLYNGPDHAVTKDAFKSRASFEKQWTNQGLPLSTDPPVQQQQQQQRQQGPPPPQGMQQQRPQQHHPGQGGGGPYGIHPQQHYQPMPMTHHHQPPPPRFGGDPGPSAFGGQRPMGGGDPRLGGFAPLGPQQPQAISPRDGSMGLNTHGFGGPPPPRPGGGGGGPIGGPMPMQQPQHPMHLPEMAHRGGPMGGAAGGHHPGMHPPPHSSMLPPPQQMHHPGPPPGGYHHMAPQQQQQPRPMPQQQLQPPHPNLPPQGAGHGQQQQPPPTTWLDFAKRALINVLRHPGAAVFAEPINEGDVPDYRQVIAQPMDLGTVAKRLASGYYQSAQQAANDVRLCFFNCRTYNKPTDEIFVIGERLEALFEREWASVGLELPPKMG